MATLPDSLRSPAAPLLDRTGAGFARLGAALYSRLTPRRLLFALAICVLASTQTFFQPILYEAISIEGIARAWLDYFTECLLMGTPIVLLLTLAEIAGERMSRVAATVLAVTALLAGAVAGALLLIPFYDLPQDAVFSRHFWGDAAYWVAIGGGVATIYGLQQRSTAAAAALHQAQVDQIALSKQMLEAQLQVMRAQIEPHFLFNTLANVRRLCQTDVSGGLVMLENLVRYLRAALPSMRKEHTTLGQEADLVHAYLAVLQIRMGSRMRYAVDIPHELRDQIFPPMMLLTLTENAIKHGLNPSPDGGAIEIRAGVVDRTIEIKVADSGVGFGAAATGGTGVGLANTRARLAALYGESAELVLEANVPTGVIATIRVPQPSAAALQSPLPLAA